MDLGLVDARVTPRDRFGNVLLVDPKSAGGFEVRARGAEFSGPLVNNVDGTYSRQLKYDPAATPALSAVFGGKTLKQVAVPTGRLRWVDRVALFSPGAEAVRGVNRHRNPEAVLGEVFKKPADVFVSLGAGGSLIVAVNNAAIQAAGNEDVTVFIAPETRSGPYRVESSYHP